VLVTNDGRFMKVNFTICIKNNLNITIQHVLKVA